jgi:hypothetical protein
MTLEDMHIIIDNAAYNQKDNPHVQALVRLARELVKQYAQPTPNPVHQKSGRSVRH